LSTRQIKKAKYRPAGILLGGVSARVDAQVSAGDVLTVCIEDGAARSPHIVPSPGTLCIVYEDDDLLVLCKQAGQPVHPSPGHDTDSLANVVMGHYAQKGQNMVFRAVNRLDRGTSGLMIVAKSAHVQNRCKEQADSGVLCRAYEAVVTGEIVPAAGVVDAPIGRKQGSALMRQVCADGAPAVTHYRTVCGWGAASLVALRLQTGRTHQIRVHMAHLGHPLVGDFLYGAEDARIGRTALHAARLSLLHPVTGAPLCFTAPLPADMRALCDALQAQQRGLAQKK
ncbi:MAG: RluA family pseudouridine synthase, partial [Eubacteriales bacterium]|nr:RluA family pseudouridine synthase [Eubacteriales bacterium]